MEVSFRNELRKLGIENIRVESAGVSKEHEGNAVDTHVAAEMRKRGLPCDSHRSRHIANIGGLTNFALIVCVGVQEARRVVRHCPTIASRVQVIPVAGEWGEDIEAACRACADYIEREMSELARRIASGEIALS